MTRGSVLEVKVIFATLWKVKVRCLLGKSLKFKLAKLQKRPRVCQFATRLYSLLFIGRNVNFGYSDPMLFLKFSEFSPMRSVKV